MQKPSRYSITLYPITEAEKHKIAGLLFTYLGYDSDMAIERTHRAIRGSKRINTGEYPRDYAETIIRHINVKIALENLLVGIEIEKVKEKV